MIEHSASSAESWEALCIEQFQLCRLDWVPESVEATLCAPATVPQLSLRMLTSGPFGVSRSIRDVRRHESDDVMVVLHDAGRGSSVEHRGHSSPLHPGDMVVIDTGRPYAFSFKEPIEHTVLKLPRALAGRLAPHAGRVARAGGTSTDRVLRTILRELADLGSLSDPHGGPDIVGIEAASLATAAIELLAAACDADSSRSSALLGHEALLKSAEDFVRTRFWDTALSPSAIAHYLGISTRLVAQIFSLAGTSPASYIRRVRLEEAARLLQSAPDRPVFDVGLRVGIPDATTFTRAFKRAYGVVPSEFRSMGVRPQLPGALPAE